MKILEFKDLLFDNYPMITNKQPENINSFRFYSSLDAIYLPDMTLEEHYDYTLNDRSAKYALFEVTNILKTRCKTKIDFIINKYQIVIFYLLHEEGHRDYYKRNYIDSEYLTAEDFIYQYNKLQKAVDNDFLNKYKDNQDSDDALRYYQKIYRRHNLFEQFADDYAINRINGTKDLLRWFKQ